MTWRERLRPASFRGVAFEVDDAGRTGGRRIAEHVYPGRDLPYPEDLGRAARAFTVEAYVIGPEYMDARDKLIAALEKKGPGRLVHPWLGEIDVVVRDYRQSESSAAGGRSNFSINFLEGGANNFPAAATDGRPAIRADADAAIGSVEVGLDDTLVTSGLPGFVTIAATGTITSAADDLQSLAGKLRSGEIAAAAFARDLAAFKTGAASLLATPSVMASRFATLVGAYTSLASGGILPESGLASGPGSSSETVRRGLVGLQAFGDGLDTIPTNTPTREIEADNQAALAGAVADIAVIEEARVLSALDFTSREAAADARDDIAERLDARIAAAGDSGDDTRFAALRRLKATTVAHLSAAAKALPGIDEYTPPVTSPSLAIANRIYGDVPDTVIGQSNDIVARNQVRHPGFTLGGSALEVLADG